MTLLIVFTLSSLLYFSSWQVQSLMVASMPERIRHDWLSNHQRFVDSWGRQYPVDVENNEPVVAGDILQEIKDTGEVGTIPKLTSSIPLSHAALSGSILSLDAYQKHTGWTTLHTDQSNDMDLLLDITDILAGDGLIMITALAAKGTYLDGYGTLRNLHEPMEQVRSTLFKLELAKDKRTVDVLQPQLTLRTSDSQSRKALDMGSNSAWVGSLIIVPTTAGQDKVVVDGIRFILDGFFVTGALNSMSAYHLTKVRSYPTNFDVSLTFIDSQGIQESVTFSVIKPPAQPMTPRKQDDRLPYFTQDYLDVGVHTKRLHRTTVDSKKFIDPSVSIIWKYDLLRLPDNQVRIYVDPSVPQRWHQSFKTGIEAWNDAFQLAGYSNRTIRAVLPTDKDWPKDYDAGDARFSTISWSIDTNAIFSMGIAKVDPRSGEILKSDILMGAGWVKAWLNDLQELKVSQSQQLTTGYYSERIHDVSLPMNDQDPPASPLQAEMEVDVESESEQETEAEGDDVLSVLGDSHMSLLAMGLPKESWYGVAAAGIKSVVMHEVGHVLGLRHNFKGSLGVSYDCTQNMSCSSKHGLTASIMDYLPMNIPSSGVEKVHLFTPVIGAYDKLAIQYGYQQVKASEESLNGLPVMPKSLESVLEKASHFQLCIDGDYSAARDPLCQPYDLTAEPLRYYEDQVLLLQKLQRTLLESAVAPGEPYWQYTNMVLKLVKKMFSIQGLLLRWIGGLNMTYAHRPCSPNKSRGKPSTSVEMISAQQQRQALRLLFELSRPHKYRLLPSVDLLSKLSFHSSTGISPVNLNATIRGYQKLLISSLLSAEKLKNIELGHDYGGLAVEGFLADVVYYVMGTYEGDEWANSTQQDWDLQLFMVQQLAALQEDSLELPESLSSKLLVAIKIATRGVDSGLKRWGKENIFSGWSRCTHPKSQMCECDGRVRLWLGNDVTAPIDSSGTVNCSSQFFGLKSESHSALCECLPTHSADSQLRLHLKTLKTKLDKAAQDKLSLTSSELLDQT